MAILTGGYVGVGFAPDCVIGCGRRVGVRSKPAVVATLAASGNGAVIKVVRRSERRGGMTGITIVLGWDMRPSGFAHQVTC